VPGRPGALCRAGGWLERVQRGFGFPVDAASAWLVWVLAQRSGINAVAIALGGLVAIAFAAWAYEGSRQAGPLARLTGGGAAALALLLALVGGYAGINGTAANAPTASASNASQANQAWEPYSAQRLQDLRAKGEPVFVNLTAAWCITCLVNERVALSQPSVSAAFQQAGITYLKGDWTKQDEQITRVLAQFGRSGVPLYAFYPKGLDAAPVVLPQLLTPEIVLAALQPSRSP